MNYWQITGRPKKSQGVDTSSTTSQPNEGVGVSNSKSELIPPPQKRPVGIASHSLLHVSQILQMLLFIIIC